MRNSAILKKLCHFDEQRWWVRGSEEKSSGTNHRIPGMAHKISHLPLTDCFRSCRFEMTSFFIISLPMAINTKFKQLFPVLVLSIFSFTAFAQNKQLKPVIAEIILPTKGDYSSLTHINTANIQLENVMKWQNRIIFYTKTANVETFEKHIRQTYSNYKVVFFQNPFYDFERKYCSNKTVAKEWTNIILSANLVKNPKMQQEYLNYHATQFQKWPEVSQGFCNADFQQLLVFKTGRQLMLVISIPKGKTLDELNPLTTKNNPRVDDWNNMMKKYQEGIKGTKKGEVWVFFKDIDKNK
jgi:hypothetical protein